MDGERKTIYDDLQRKLGAYPVDDFVRAYLKAYLEADVETIRKLQELLLGDLSDSPDSSGHSEPDSHIGAYSTSPAFEFRSNRTPGACGAR